MWKVLDKVNTPGDEEAKAKRNAKRRGQKRDMRRRDDHHDRKDDDDEGCAGGKGKGKVQELAFSCDFGHGAALPPMETAREVTVEEHVLALNTDRRLVPSMVTLEVEPAYRRRHPTGHQIRSLEHVPLPTECSPI